METNGASNGGAPRAAVVGGGVAGISAADRLRAAGYRTEIFEAGDRLGGRIAVDRLDGREACLGGKNIGRKYTEFRALTERGAEEPRRWEFFGPETMQLMNGKLVPMSYRRMSARMKLASRMLMRGQIPGAIKFVPLARRVSRNEPSGFLGDAWFQELARKHDHPTLTRYFGEGFSSTAIRHTTVRMNGAEPDEVWLGNFGSNLALVVDKFDQLTDGLEPVMRAAAERHEVHLGAPVERLLAAAGGRVSGVVTGDGEEHDRYDAVVLATDARAAAKITRSLDRDLAAMLGSIVYKPVAVVVAAYDRPLFPAEYAAIATPSDLALSNAGSYGLDDRHIVRLTFSGYAARGRIEPDVFDPEKLVAEAEEFLSKYLPIKQARRVDQIARSFVPGLCSYRRDHGHFLSSVDRMLGAHPGLALAGDYTHGCSLEACTRSGIAAGDRVAGSRLPASVEAAAAGGR